MRRVSLFGSSVWLTVILVCRTLPAQSVPLRVSVETTRITAPLKGNGQPDYYRAMEQNVMQGVTPENNFWYLVWPALGNAERSSDAYIQEVERKLGVAIPEQGLYSPLVPHVRTELEIQHVKDVFARMDTAMQGPWQREELPEIALWLDTNEKLLAVVTAASQRSHSYAPMASDGGHPDSLPWVLFPHAKRSQDIARMLICRSMLRLGNGDTAAAWDDLKTTLRIACHVEGGFSIVERLVGASIRSMTHKALNTWLNHCGLGAEQLAAQHDELKPLLSIKSFADHVDRSERFMTLQMVLVFVEGARSRAAFEQDISAQPVFGVTINADDLLMQQLKATRGPLMKYLMAGSDINQTLQEVNRNYDAYVAALQLPTHPERCAALSHLTSLTDEDIQIAGSGAQLLREFMFASDEDYRRLPARLMSGMMAPALMVLNEFYTRALARNATLLAAFEAAEALQRTGNVPTTLSQRDPYTEGELHIRDASGVITIYSYGENLEDEDGKTFGEGVGTDDIRATLLHLAHPEKSPIH